jgi:hypothetical protein
LTSQDLFLIIAAGIPCFLFVECVALSGFLKGSARHLKKKASVTFTIFLGYRKYLSMGYDEIAELAAFLLHLELHLLLWETDQWKIEAS